MDLKDLLINPFILAFLIFSYIWLSNSRWLCTITPISFSWFNCFNYVAFILFVWQVFSFLLIDIDTHLSGLNLSCHLSAHFSIISSWRIFWSSVYLMFLNIFVSSANKKISDFTWSGRSFINMTNNNGSSTLPFGIPLVTSLYWDDSSFTITCWVLLLRNAFIQQNISPLMPYLSTFFNNLWWGTLPNAFWNHNIYSLLMHLHQ